MILFLGAISYVNDVVVFCNERASSLTNRARDFCLLESRGLNNLEHAIKKCPLAGANAHSLPVLDGVHVGVRRHAVLPAAAGLHGAAVRPRLLHLHAGLGQHGGLHHHAGHPGAGAQRHIHRVQLPVHLQHDAPHPQRGADPRQGVRHGAGGQPGQPESHDVLRAGGRVLAELGALRRGALLRVHDRRRAAAAPAALRRGVDRGAQLAVEAVHPDRAQSAVPPGAAAAVPDGVLPQQGASAGGAGRPGQRRLDDRPTPGRDCLTDNSDRMLAIASTG